VTVEAVMAGYGPVEQRASTPTPDVPALHVVERLTAVIASHRPLEERPFFKRALAKQSSGEAWPTLTERGASLSKSPPSRTAGLPRRSAPRNDGWGLSENVLQSAATPRPQPAQERLSRSISCWRDIPNL